MKVAIVPIGNSRGVRLPKALLDQYKFTDAAELTVEDGRIVLSPLGAPRAGWAQAFAAAPQDARTDEEEDWLEAPLDAADDD